MIAVCPNKECNQRYRIQPAMMGRIAKCKKCNTRFKIEEPNNSPKPLELKPLETTTKPNSNNKLESETSFPSSKTESSPAPRNQSSGKTVRNALFLLAIAVIGVAASLFVGNFHAISGSSKGLSVVRRDAFGFSEFFINADEITRTPSLQPKHDFRSAGKFLKEKGSLNPTKHLKSG